MTTRRHRSRPRYGRIAALGAALTVTLITGLAGLGVLTTGSTAAAHQLRTTAYDGGSASPSTTPSTSPSSAPSSAPSTSPTHRPSSGATDEGPTNGGIQHSQDAADDTTLPASSGEGRRVVFSQHLQRVWLVGPQGAVRRTYLVSGSVTDNLQPGHYSVYSRSRWAVGVDDSGVMQWFVRFTQGPTGAAIGFHSIPTKNGDPLQTKAQLGTPQSHGCIRQATPDAVAMWAFAQSGTKVVVVA